jgi:hypothetical protein
VIPPVWAISSSSAISVISLNRITISPPRTGIIRAGDGWVVRASRRAASGSWAALVGILLLAGVKRILSACQPMQQAVE